MSKEINKEIRDIKLMLIWLVFANVVSTIHTFRSSYRNSETMEEISTLKHENSKALLANQELDAFLKCDRGAVCETLFPDAAERMRKARESTEKNKIP